MAVGGLGPADLFDLFAQAYVTVQATCFLMVLAAPVLAVLAASARAKRRPQPALPIVGASMAVLGGMAAAYGFLTIALAVADLGPVRLEVMAPSIAESLLPLALGLALAAFAFGANPRAARAR